MDDENNYFFFFDEEHEEKRSFVVICYDIQNNKRRYRFSKFLEHYAIRVQRSVFEAELSPKTYKELVAGIDRFTNEDDSIRLYRIGGGREVQSWGKDSGSKIEEVVII